MLRDQSSCAEINFDVTAADALSLCMPHACRATLESWISLRAIVVCEHNGAKDVHPIELQWRRLKVNHGKTAAICSYAVLSLPHCKALNMSIDVRLHHIFVHCPSDFRKATRFARAFVAASFLTLGAGSVLVGWATSSSVASSQKSLAGFPAILSWAGEDLPQEFDLRQPLQTGAAARLAQAMDTSPSSDAYQRFLDAPEAATGATHDRLPEDSAGESSDVHAPSPPDGPMSGAPRATGRPAPLFRPEPIQLPRPKAHAR